MNATTNLHTTTSPERRALGEIRSALRDLHRAILADERIQYERAFGRIRSEFQLLVLAAEDPQFAWLRPLAALIVDIDERFAGAEEFSAADLRQIGEEIRALLVPEGTPTTFQRIYQRVMQENPGVIMAHSAVMRSLPRATRSGK